MRSCAKLFEGTLGQFCTNIGRLISELAALRDELSDTITSGLAQARLAVAEISTQNSLLEEPRVGPHALARCSNAGARP